ncbi:hypothetical protein BCR41DRAFT_386605 [Lobosporangium transversale]|uniref:Uncharacterized protein n=1 Tax=Lobosporangium transversale TaxID=64571 RepID=A0A1Y2GM92_9FUNG|nr:hypothetical protein BCR41DRAFT_386605 [Lobosporangium transversale]ORZ15478.1 hypothetical protein BCR41DRAFT_386605 [Lobosporangium transversale]|eukprot:XP_021881226.1 hypothetical protein BCR41DRAFT_386605 [Lobosporangium transversale]
MAIKTRNDFANGLVLNPLAYDTVQTKRQQQSDVDEEDLSQGLKLSQGFLNTACFKGSRHTNSSMSHGVVPETNLQFYFDTNLDKCPMDVMCEPTSYSHFCSLVGKGLRLEKVMVFFYEEDYLDNI